MPATCIFTTLDKKRPIMNLFNFLPIAVGLSLMATSGNYKKQQQTNVAQDTTEKRLKITLPSKGKFVNDKPVGKGWVNMLSSLDTWVADPKYWSLKSGVL